MLWLVRIAVLLLSPCAAAAASAGGLPSFQALVDAAPAGEILLVPPGTYAGPVVIEKPLSIYGGGEVVIDNAGLGTIVQVKANRVTLAGLVLRNCGEQHTKLDAALHVRSHFNTFKDLVIEECLFGIDLAQANNNILRRNRISSRTEFEMGLKGDAIRIWYSHQNKVEDNHIENSRDGILVWYARSNEITGNTVIKGRYGLHFMYSDHNKAEGNRFYRNTVGIFAMFVNSLVLHGNEVIESRGPSGMGIGMKEATEAVVTDNSIIGNATGLYLDTSPNDPDFQNVFEGNRIAFNGTAVSFHSDWAGNHYRGNDFFGNHTQVTVRGGGSAARNLWEGNYWDLYEGFDADRDGIGDTPLELYGYADRLWMDVPAASFFRGSPVLELIDFLERLAPFSEPRLMLRDAKPALRRVAEPVS